MKSDFYKKAFKIKIMKKEIKKIFSFTKNIYK